MTSGAAGAAPFRLGINYLPPEAGMGWLRPYDPERTRSHFRRAAEAGFDSVRVFLPWEDAQPTPDVVDPAVLRHLEDTAEAAAEAEVTLIVTLFVGHMSGVNWAPFWATGGGEGDPRFRVIAGGREITPGSGLRNWYADPDVVAAQERLAGAAARALAGHPAVWAWDLGNENSNCTIPPDRRSGESWLERMTAAIRRADPGRPITAGTHMEDLEEDRRIGPAETARYCDFVSMHGYPIYADWAAGPTDDQLLPFLSLITRWLARGTDVLFEEFGLPTLPTTDGHDAEPGDPRLVTEPAAAAYTGRVLDGLRAAGCTGALLWCFADYAPALYELPPLEVATHERSFGLWRPDGSPKPAVAEVTRRVDLPAMPPPALPWLDIGVEEFEADRRGQLIRLYGRYRANNWGSRGQ